MALYIPHSIFHLARLLCVKPETFGPYYVELPRNLIFGVLLKLFESPKFGSNITDIKEIVRRCSLLFRPFLICKCLFAYAKVTSKIHFTGKSEPSILCLTYFPSKF